MIRLNDMAKRLGVSVKTLQRWDREGILVAKRNPNNRRYYTEDQYLEYIGSSKKIRQKINGVQGTPFFTIFSSKFYNFFIIGTNKIAL